MISGTEALHKIQLILDSEINPRDLVSYDFKRKLIKMYEDARAIAVVEVHQEDHQRREIARQNQQQLDEKAVNWATANLQPGMIIKVVGARDGIGARKVIEIQHKSKEVWCRKLRLDSQTGKVIEEPHITSHMFKKVRGTLGIKHFPGAEYIKYKWEIEDGIT